MIPKKLRRKEEPIDVGGLVHTLTYQLLHPENFRKVNFTEGSQTLAELNAKWARDEKVRERWNFFWDLRVSHEGRPCFVCGLPWKEWRSQRHRAILTKDFGIHSRNYTASCLMSIGNYEDHIDCCSGRCSQRWHLVNDIRLANEAKRKADLTAARQQLKEVKQWLRNQKPPR